MKILLLHQKLGFQGGAEQYIYNTAPALREHFTLDLAFGENTDIHSESFAEAFDQVHDVAEYGWSIQEVVKKSKPDLIYLHNTPNLSWLEDLQNITLPKVRMVHDHESYCMRGYRYSPWSRKACTKKAGLPCLVPCLAPIKRDRSLGTFGVRWESWRDKMREIHLNKQLDAFFVGSTFMKDELILQGFDADKIDIVPPIPLPAKNKIQSSFASDNIVLFIGQVIRGKGLDCLIDALALLETHWHLCVIGQGSHLDYCKQRVAALGLLDRVEFVGYLPQAEILDYMSESTLLAVPSVWPEPFGAVGVEAMRQGLPVVAFDSGGISDWLSEGETGYLVPPHDLPGLARRIECLLLDKDHAKKLGEAGRVKAEQTFNFSQQMHILVSRLQTFARKS